MTVAAGGGVAGEVGESVSVSVEAGRDVPITVEAGRGVPIDAGAWPQPDKSMAMRIIPDRKAAFLFIFDSCARGDGRWLRKVSTQADYQPDLWHIVIDYTGFRKIGVGAFP